jgi:hypothetical protein
MKRLEVVTSLICLLAVTGCNNQGTQPTKKTEETNLKAISAPPQDGRTTHEDVQGAIAECQTLIGSLRSILHTLRDSEASALTDELKGKIDACKKGEETWSARIEKLLANTGKLAGGKGPGLYPEISLALKRLNRAGKFLEQSMEALQAHDLQTARASIKRARVITNRASEILVGRLKQDDDTDE